MSDDQLRTLDDMLRDGPLDLGGELQEQRRLLVEMLTSIPLPDDVVTTSGELGGVPVITVDIHGVGAGGVVLYLHGGAYAMGTAQASLGLASDVARRNEEAGRQQGGEQDPLHEVLLGQAQWRAVNFDVPDATGICFPVGRVTVAVVLPGTVTMRSNRQPVCVHSDATTPRTVSIDAATCPSPAGTCGAIAIDAYPGAAGVIPANCL